MVKILRKEGWILNPNDKVVNSILKRIENNKGNCPCSTKEERKCPCYKYLQEDNCCCTLYVKEVTDSCK